jgi:hypothetical protein
MRIFLLRPVLLALFRRNQEPESEVDVDDSVEDTVELDRLVRVSKTCVIITRALIDLIYEDLHNGTDPSIVWWYGVYCEYPSILFSHNRTYG